MKQLVLRISNKEGKCSIEISCHVMTFSFNISCQVMTFSFNISCQVMTFSFNISCSHPSESKNASKPFLVFLTVLIIVLLGATITLSILYSIERFNRNVNQTKPGMYYKILPEEDDQTKVSL